jgi:hypothetical protein
MNKYLSFAARDWTFNTLLGYSSGLPILAPYANNQLNQSLLRNVVTAFVGSSPSTASTGTFANRVPGVPLFLQDLNCHCFDPNTTFALNPAAWSDPPAGTFSTSAPYYNDYRLQRRPNENVGVGRIFRLRERVSLNVRVEFNNIFNRAQMPNPAATNAAAPQLTNAKTGAASSGFGFINTATTSAVTNAGTDTSRQGTIVARITF